MYIIVCVKQVRNYKIGKCKNLFCSETGDIFNNPSDLVVLDYALRLKKLYGFDIITISMGPFKNISLVKELYYYDVDRAILLTSPFLAGSDTYATTYALKTIIEKMFPYYTLIMCGDKSLDGETGQVPHSLAMALRINSYSNLSKISYNDKQFEVICKEKSLEREIKEKKLLVTVSQELDNYDIFPKLKNIIDSENKKVEIVSCKDLNIQQENVGQKGSYTKVVKLYEKSSMPKRNSCNIFFDKNNINEVTSLMKYLFGEKL